MNDLEFSFEQTPWEAFLMSKGMGDTVSAATLLSLLEGDDEQQLEDALRRTAVACYAVEGFYPPDVDYMVQHYGLQYDEDSYRVHYEIFASNLMPEITVVEKGK